MKKIEIIKTGFIYRNPQPYLYSRQASHPSVVQLENGEMLAAMSIGQAFESADNKAYIARSADNGETWELDEKLFEGNSKYPSSEGVRIGPVDGNEVTAYVLSANRSRTDKGLTNPENLGFVETEFYLLKTSNGGLSWSEGKRFKPPLTGPSFEICSPISVLSDGRFILPTQTWMGWDGYCPNGLRMVAFISYDKGETWPDYMDVMRDEKNEIIYWESKVVEFPDGKLLACAWAYDKARRCDLPNQYALSSDRGKSFTKPRSTGLTGQTMTQMVLKDGKVLSVYRRMDKKGLWANISRIEGDLWINEEQYPLWGSDLGGLVSTEPNMANNFWALKFGAPNILYLNDGIVYIAFWCVEDCVYNIRWIKIRLNGD